MIIETDNPTQQKDIFSVYVNETQRIEVQAYKKAIKKAGNALLRAGVLCFCWDIISMCNSNTDFSITWLIIALAEVTASISLAFWTKTKPYSAILTGLIFFIGLITVATISHALLQGSSVAQKAHFSSMIIKIVVIASLALQLKDARALQQIKKQGN